MLPVMDEGSFSRETAVRRTGDGTYTATMTPHWNIGDNANGGYMLSPVLRALLEETDQPDPVSITAHYLGAVQPDGSAATIEAVVVKPGRSISVGRAALRYAGRERLIVLGAFGDLSKPASEVPATIDLPAPVIPSPDECVQRSGDGQGVTLAITDRLDVRLVPDATGQQTAQEAVTEGWVRFRDGTEPSTLALPLFADGFPPSLFPRFGEIGWVPTIELTVQVRRPPAPGWIQARFECDDLHDGRMIETGVLWDSTGQVVARSRQLGLLLGRAG